MTKGTFQSQSLVEKTVIDPFYLNSFLPKLVEEQIPWNLHHVHIPQNWLARLFAIGRWAQCLIRKTGPHVPILRCLGIRGLGTLFFEGKVNCSAMGLRPKNELLRNGILQGNRQSKEELRLPKTESEKKGCCVSGDRCRKPSLTVGKLHLISITVVNDSRTSCLEAKERHFL